MIDTNDCWLYAGYKNSLGYGSFENGGITYRAHRAMYEDARGTIPFGLVIDHLCRVPSCINPLHLEPVSVRTNILRGIGLAAQASKQERCAKAGHPFTSSNIYWRKAKYDTGRMWRVCKTCRKQQTAERAARRKLAKTY